MRVSDDRGRHRHPKDRLPRAITTVLLITLLLGIPAGTSTSRPEAYVTSKER